MTEKTDTKTEALPDLDDLLQCPVCYEIPSGQIFQCNEGHHVCGRCKARLDVCPVCRAFFFGTRNYAMEELIANIKRLRAFKLGGKVTSDTISNESTTPVESTTENNEVETEEADEENNVSVTSSTSRPPPACKGLFRCLCCKNGNGERLPSARLLNHLRYYHAAELIEGKSESGEYVQAWQFSTAPGRLVTAVRVSDMGIFFLNIEINNDCLCAWLSMAAAPWVAHEFSYTVTISGNDREAIFSDCVWSVRSCEGSLRKRGHCLVVNGLDARALVAPAAIAGKLSVRRTPPEQVAAQTQPRAVLRVANRSDARDPRDLRDPRDPRTAVQHDLEPFLQDLQNDVARLSRAFATFGREATALVRSEAEIRARIDVDPRRDQAPPVPPPAAPAASEVQPLSRNARRRMRQRLRAALNAPQSPSERAPPAPTPRPLVSDPLDPQILEAVRAGLGLAIVQQSPPTPPPQSSGGPSSARSQNGSSTRGKKKRRHRR